MGITISHLPFFFLEDIERKWQKVTVCSPFLLMRIVGPAVGMGAGMRGPTNQKLSAEVLGNYFF